MQKIGVTTLKSHNRSMYNMMAKNEWYLPRMDPVVCYYCSNVNNKTASYLGMLVANTAKTTTILQNKANVTGIMKYKDQTGTKNCISIFIAVVNN